MPLLTMAFYYLLFEKFLPCLLSCFPKICRENKNLRLKLKLSTVQGASFIRPGRYKNPNENRSNIFPCKYFNISTSDKCKEFITHYFSNWSPGNPGNFGNISGALSWDFQHWRALWAGTQECTVWLDCTKLTWWWWSHISNCAQIQSSAPHYIVFRFSLIFKERPFARGYIRKEAGESCCTFKSLFRSQEDPCPWIFPCNAMYSCSSILGFRGALSFYMGQ